MFYIKNDFTNYKNQYFDNVREIHFDAISDIGDNLGSFVLESHNSKKPGLLANDGIYLYNSKTDASKGYRIYKDFANYKYIYYFDDILISNLQKVQSNVKLTEFPTGVVTIGGKVIGQEIPYYKDSVNINDYFSSYSNKKIITSYYLEILKIVKELFNNGIIYRDINCGNFLVNAKNNEKINLIDFDPMFTFFSDKKDFSYNVMIEHLKHLIEMLNLIKNIKFISSFYNASTLEELEESILENEKKLIKQT